MASSGTHGTQTLRSDASYGGLAQLGERLHGMQEVTGSIPVFSTTKTCQRNLTGLFFGLNMRKKSKPVDQPLGNGEMNSKKQYAKPRDKAGCVAADVPPQREGEQQKPGHGKAVQQKRGKLPAAEHPPDLNGLKGLRSGGWCQRRRSTPTRRRCCVYSWTRPHTKTPMK